MCVSCGCGQVNDNHGDRRNITLDDVRAAAQAANTDERAVAQSIQQGVNQSQGKGGWQQSQMSGQGSMPDTNPRAQGHNRPDYGRGSQ